MFRGLRERFFLPRSKDWFCEGLAIESASDRSTAAVLPRLSETFPYVKWDLLSRHEHPGFRFLFRIKRPLGGLRLLFSARHHYEIVVFFRVPGDRDLRLHCWLALLLMRPRRFFVFIEGGDGFWLAVDDAQKIRKYFYQRWGRYAAVQAVARFRGRLSAFGNELRQRSWREILWLPVRALGRGTVAGARLLVHGLRWLALLLYGAATLSLAVALLGFFRLFYDTYYYRFRLFGKKQVTLHPRRQLGRLGPGQAVGEPGPELSSRPPVV